MDTIFRTYYEIEWHSGNDIPELGREVIALIEEDMSLQMAPEPELVTAKVRYIEGNNPPYLWDIEQEDGTTTSNLIAGGSSVILWRYTK